MNTRKTAVRSSPWVWIPAVWIAFSVIHATEAVVSMKSEGMHHAWGRLFLSSSIEWLAWALATAPIMRLTKRFPPTSWRPVSTWFIHLGACLATNFTFAAWSAWLDALLDPYKRHPPRPSFVHLWLQYSFGSVLAAIIIYSVIVAVSIALESRRRLASQQLETARLNEQLSKAQLDAVRRQIEPHFLFNTLNSVSGLIRENRNDAAVMMIAGLSDFLRRLLADPTRQQVPLAEEMEFAQKYLDIQKVRFVDRLQLAIDVPTDLLVAQVPTLILQLMLENAIKHGISKRAQGGLVRISASRDNGTLTLSVYNDGPNLPVTIPAPSGIGLTNMRTRLQGLYGEGFALDMRNQQPHGVEVSVSVPFIEN